MEKEHAKEDRDIQVFEAFIRGQKIGELSRAFGLSAKHVMEILYMAAVRLTQPKMLGAAALPWGEERMCFPWEVARLRRYADFWLAQIAKLEAGRAEATSSSPPRR